MCRENGMRVSGQLRRKTERWEGKEKWAVWTRGRHRPQLLPSVDKLELHGQRRPMSSITTYWSSLSLLVPNQVFAGFEKHRNRNIVGMGCRENLFDMKIRAMHTHVIIYLNLFDENMCTRVISSRIIFIKHKKRNAAMLPPKNHKWKLSSS